ncbi:hypothetical protein DRN93_03350 [archaeon]|nr:MAG: hypothetical protein DRN93_03350 [archaeon]
MCKAREACKMKDKLKVDSFRSSSKAEKEEVAQISKKVKDVGIDLERSGGKYLLVDSSVMARILDETYGESVVIRDIRDSSVESDVRDLRWGILKRDLDDFTQLVSKELSGGYYIRVKENTHVNNPVQTCLYVATENLRQLVHNIIVLEPNTSLHIITGCTTGYRVTRGLHIGVSEFYLKEGSSLTYTMIHSWPTDFHTRPRTGILMEKNAKLVMNYITLNPGSTIHTSPKIYCKGDGSSCLIQNIIASSTESHIDVGADVFLEGESTGAELRSRVAAFGPSITYARGRIYGCGSGTKGHIECNGLILHPGAKIRAVPELIAETTDTTLTHEAAVGKIADEEISYIMSRGFSRSDAVSLIVRGFMDVSSFNLPKITERKVENLIKRIVESSFI